MSNSGTIRVGKKIHAQVGIRIRHVKVTTVADQDTLTVQLGRPAETILGFTLGDAVYGILGVRRLAYASNDMDVERTASTTTRGTLFTQG